MKELSIGRSKDNDIVVSDVSVSRNHAKLIVIDSNNFKIVDNNSTNGTYVNGTRINGSRNIRYNDIVKLGNAVVPWRNYIGGNVPLESPLRQENRTYSPQPSYPNYIPTEKKSNAGTVFLVMIGITFLLSLGYYFLIYKTDSRKIIGKWTCVENCDGGLKEITFYDKDNSNKAEFEFGNELNIDVNGKWHINEKRKIIKFTIESNDNESEFEYEFVGNKLILDEIDSSDKPIELMKVD